MGFRYGMVSGCCASRMRDHYRIPRMRGLEVTTHSHTATCSCLLMTPPMHLAISRIWSRCPHGLDRGVRLCELAELWVSGWTDLVFVTGSRLPAMACCTSPSNGSPGPEGPSGGTGAGSSRSGTPSESVIETQDHRVLDLVPVGGISPLEQILRQWYH